MSTVEIGSDFLKGKQFLMLTEFSFWPCMLITNMRRKINIVRADEAGCEKGP